MRAAKLLSVVMKRDDVAEIEAEIARVREEGAAAVKEIERLEASRLDAQSFEEVERLEREAAKVKWTADRASAQLAQLEERLRTARAERHAAAIVRHRTRMLKLYPKLRAAIEAAAAVQIEAIAAREEAAREIGEHAATAHLPHLAYRGLLLPDLVAMWGAEMERIISGPAPAVKATARPAATKPQPAPTLQRPVRVDEPQPPASRAPALADDLAPLGEGEVRVRVLRSGYPDANGVQCHQGRIIRLPRDLAQMAAKNGAVEHVKEDNANA